MTIGERIKKIREMNNDTQDDLARKIGKKQGVISAIEKNNSNITTEALMIICNEYKVSADWILFGRESTNDVQIKYNMLNMEERNIVDLIFEKAVLRQVNS